MHCLPRIAGFAEPDTGSAIEIHSRGQIADRTPAHTAGDPLHRYQGNDPGKGRGTGPDLPGRFEITDLANPPCILLVLGAGFSLCSQFLDIPGAFPAAAVTGTAALRDLEFFVIGRPNGPAFRGFASRRSGFPAQLRPAPVSVRQSGIAYRPVHNSTGPVLDSDPVSRKFRSHRRTVPADSSAEAISLVRSTVPPDLPFCTAK